MMFLPRTLGLSHLKDAFSLSRISPTIYPRTPYSTMPSAITLYSWPTPNGIKASITLEELGVPYKLEPINIATNIQKEEYANNR